MGFSWWRAVLTCICSAVTVMGDNCTFTLMEDSIDMLEEVSLIGTGADCQEGVSCNCRIFLGNFGDDMDCTVNFENSGNCSVVNCHLDFTCNITTTNTSTTAEVGNYTLNNCTCANTSTTTMSPETMFSITSVATTAGVAASTAGVTTDTTSGSTTTTSTGPPRTTDSGGILDVLSDPPVYIGIAGGGLLLIIILLFVCIGCCILCSMRKGECMCGGCQGIS